MLKPDQSKKYISELCRRGLTFQIFESGQSLTVVPNDGKKHRFLDISKEQRNAGYHLPAMIGKHVRKRIKDGSYTPKNKDNDRISMKTIFYCKENIEKAIENKTECWYVDINSCYWYTARIIGLIDEKLYQQGNKGGKEWKAGRNVAIGSLGTTVFIHNFVNGKKVGENFVTKNTNVCRLDVVDYVWEMANRVSEKLKDNVCMYLTDAFFVNSTGAKNKLIELLAKEGYTCKYEPVEFVGINKIYNRIIQVQWYRPQHVTNDMIGNKKIPYHFFGINNVPNFLKNGF